LTKVEGKRGNKKGLKKPVYRRKREYGGKQKVQFFYEFYLSSKKGSEQVMDA